MLGSLNINVKTLWSVVGFVVLLAILWLIVARATTELIVIAFAIIFAEGLRPIVAWLDGRGLNRSLAIAVVIVGVIAIVLGLLWLVMAPLIAQVASLIDNAPQILAHVQGWFAQYQNLLHHNVQARQMLGQLPERLSSLAASQAVLLVSLPLAFGRLVFDVFLILLLTVFWLAVAPELSTFVLTFVARTKREYGRSVLDELSLRTGGYLRGLVINMFVIGIISGLGVYFLGVPYPLLLGVVAGLTEAIPIVGPFIGGAVSVVTALATLGWHQALFVLILYVVIQQIESNTLVPLVMNRAVNLHPLAIVVALIIGAALLGVAGAVLSLPAAAVIKVLVLRLAAPAARSAADST